MDRKIEKKKFTPARVLGASVLLAGGIFLLLGLLNTSGSTTRIGKEKLILSQVVSGDFQEYIPVDGNVMPVKSVVIDAVEAGRVAEKYVEDGALVKQGQPLLRLVNTDLQLDFLNRETQVFDLINNLQNTRYTLEQNKVNRLSQLADAEFELLEAERKLSVDESLYKDKVITTDEYQRSRNNHDYLKKKVALLRKAIVTDSLTAAGQIHQMRESLGRMQTNLGVMKQKTEDLIVKAPVSGQLSAFVAEVGELKTKGQNLAQVDVLTGFKIRAGVDEHYISRISIGQQAGFEYNGKKYRLTVKNIYPQVKDGKFTIDLFFEQEAPAGLRRGQTLPLKLELGGTSRALMLARGGFYQSTGGNWVYVLDKDGQTARKRNVRIGRQNAACYEVTEGLAEGEQVITSSYDLLGDADEIIIRE